MIKIVLCLLFAFDLCAQPLLNNTIPKAKTAIYLFPGQGADERIFDSLKFLKKLDSSYSFTFINYGLPPKGSTIKSMAQSLISQIDTSSQVILIGVSLGGMICSELNEIINTKKTIIISSAKNRTELPFRYRFQKAIPIYKFIPGIILRGGAKFLQPVVEPDRKKNKATFKSMLAAKSAKYMKRSVAMIIKWDKIETVKTQKIVHIHGTNDHTLPIKKIKVTHVIGEGSHMMTLTRFAEINKLIEFELNL